PFQQLHKANAPTAQPRIKALTSSTCILLSASNTGSYMPSNSKIKLPEMPGNNMAQMANAPATKNNKGDRPSVYKPGRPLNHMLRMLPNKDAHHTCKRLSGKGRHTTTVPIRIRPQKKAHRGIAALAKNQRIINTEGIMLVTIPASNNSKKVKFACCHTARKPCWRHVVIKRGCKLPKVRMSSA